jgi:WD40 repeat protein
MNEASLRLLDAPPGQGHAGEVFAVAYSSDGAFALSGGWDGHLRLWETTSGTLASSLEVSRKPLSACAFSPDDQQWLAGSMEGLLSAWDAAGYQAQYNFLAHTRPISAIRFGPDGQQLATASWDRQVGLRKVGKEREARMLNGHSDIVAGCRYTPDAKHLLSWSHDGGVVLWDAEFGQQAWAPPGHQDRVVAGAVSPDGRWAATASRDGLLKLWDLVNRGEAGTLPLSGEVRGCFFLLDGESVVIVNAEGWMTWLSIPTFEVRAELETGLKVQCGEIAPSGAQIALGSDDGHVYFVTIAGFDQGPLVVTAIQAVKQTATMLDKFLGKQRMMRTFRYVCPACRHAGETHVLPENAFPCPSCRRRLRVLSQGRQLQQQ